MKPLFFLLGWFFFAIGAIGVVVPGSPTTPFMILALWAFSKSSRRFHDWLYQHPVFGPPLQSWVQHRVISARVKVIALLTMAGSLVYMVFGTSVSGWVVALSGPLMAYAAYFILSKPSKPLLD